MKSKLKTLLEDCLYAFNAIPNKTVKKDLTTYNIASRLGNILPEVERHESLEFVPDAANGKWDNIEIHPVIELTFAAWRSG